MTRSTILLLLILSMGAGYLYSCSNAKAGKQIDAVHGIAAVDVHDIDWRKQFIAALKPLTPEQRKAEIDKVVPKLNTRLIENLRSSGYTCKVKSITYVFGSGTADGVKSGDGKTYDNTVFNDDLYAVVKGEPCFGDSVMAFVECFNGVFRITGGHPEVIGTYQPIFTIGKGWGINRYVDYMNAIWLAETFDLKLHEGQGWKGKLLTPAQARERVDRLGEKAVTVEVYEGDVFDLGAMTYTHQGKVRLSKK